MRDQSARLREFRRPRQHVTAGVVEQDELGVVGTDRVLDEIRGEQRNALAPPLVLRILLEIAAFGGENRHEELPLVPLAAAGKATVEAAVALWYFYQMPTKEKAWCGYCIAGALVNVGIAALTLPEAKRALKALTED